MDYARLRTISLTRGKVVGRVSESPRRNYQLEYRELRPLRRTGYNLEVDLGLLYNNLDIFVWAVEHLKSYCNLITGLNQVALYAQARLLPQNMKP